MRTITLNIIKGYGLTPMLNVSQFDKGYTVTATVQKGAEAFTPPTGSTATVEGRKPDGTGYQYPATIDGSTVTFTMAEQMTVLSGRSMAEIVFYDADSVRIGTANFYLLVEEAPMNESTVISETDLPTIQQALDLLKNGALAPGIIGTASGDVAAFADGARDTALSSLAVNIEPVQDLHGYDKPWVGGGGKNLFNADRGAGTASGVTFTNDNGIITASGAATANAYRVVGTFQTVSGVSYILTGCPAGGGSGKYRMTVAGLGYDTGNGLTFTGDGEAHNVSCDVYTGQTLPITFSPMIRLASETDATYEPYENISPISGWTEANVTRAGKNLLPSHAVGTVTSNGITWTVNADGTVTANGTASANSTLYIPDNVFNVPVSAPLILTGCPTDGSSSKYRIFAYKYLDGVSTGASVSDLGSGATLDPTDGTFNQVRIALRVTSGYTADNLVFCPMLRVASVMDATYEPYAGETFPVTLPTEAGTVYGGTLDIVTGKLIVDRVKKTIKWSKYTSKTSLGDYTRGLYRISDPAVYPQSASVPQLSNIAKYKAAYAENSLHFYVTQENINMFLPNNTDGDTDTEVAYELATPLEYTLTPQEINTLYGYNTIYADCGSIESVEYTADTKMYIDAKVAELQALILENA